MWLGRSAAATVVAVGGGANGDEEGMGEKRSFSRASAEPEKFIAYITFTEGSEKYKTNSEELFYQSKRNIFMNKLAEILNLKNTVYSFNY